MMKSSTAVTVAATPVDQLPSSRFTVPGSTVHSSPTTDSAIETVVVGWLVSVKVKMSEPAGSLMASSPLTSTVTPATSLSLTVAVTSSTGRP